MLSILIITTSLGIADPTADAAAALALAKAKRQREQVVRVEPTSPPATPTYADVLARVRSGETLTVAIGVAEPASVAINAVDGISPGVWRFFPVNGQPWFEPASPTAVIPSPSSIVNDVLSPPGSR